MNESAPFQSIERTIGVSSISGSYNFGNLKGINSWTDIFISFNLVMNFGGLVCIIFISNGNIRELYLTVPSVPSLFAKIKIVNIVV